MRKPNTGQFLCEALFFICSNYKWLINNYFAEIYRIAQQNKYKIQNPKKFYAS